MRCFTLRSRLTSMRLGYASSEPRFYVTKVEMSMKRWLTGYLYIARASAVPPGTQQQHCVVHSLPQHSLEDTSRHLHG